MCDALSITVEVPETYLAGKEVTLPSVSVSNGLDFLGYKCDDCKKVYIFSDIKFKLK